MASGNNIQDLLGYTSLCGTINATTMGVPKVLPEKFYNTKRNVLCDSGRYTQVTGTRTTARIVQYGSPAQLRNLKNIAVRDAKLMHSFESIQFDPIVFQALREYDSYNLQQMAGEEVTRQVLNFKTNFENLRSTAFLQTLANGVIYYDSNNNLLPSSSNAFVTIDFGMQANNQNQLNGIISSTWANYATNIPLQIQNLKNQALKDTGYPLKYAFYGTSIPTYLSANNYVEPYLARNVPMAQPYLSDAELPANLFGLTWVPVGSAFFEDADGTNQTVVGTNKVIFTPEPSGDWWEVLEGSYPVPTTFNVMADGVAAMRALKSMHGMFAYAAMNSVNPPGVTMYAGDTFLGVIKVPNAVYQATVAGF